MTTPTGSDDPPPRLRVLLQEKILKGEMESTHRVHLVGEGRKKAFRILPAFPTRTIACQKGQIRLGNLLMPKGEILLVPEWNGAIRWEGKKYRGSFLLRPVSSTRFHVLNIVHLEDYVAGVLPTEMGAKAPLEALKAQAICARTYAFAQMKERAQSGFDAYADVRDQVYGGIHKNPVFERATKETRGQLLFHKTGPFKSYFHSTCGGETESVSNWKEDPEIEPLSGSPCGTCSHAKWYRWQTQISREEISRAFETKTGKATVVGIKITKWNQRNRIKEIVLKTDSPQNIYISGAEFRKRVGANRIRSTRWTLSPTPTGWALLGKGWGHGVGLCQEGAMGFARKGGNAISILKRYYPGASLQKIYR